ncbi:aminotransferase class IV family protein [Streptomyces sp. NPDC126499]|uniref:aminotransferase class IV family protein n=1 Tax=Streptomyces sp. NPDC126499 TaxID=3155314 RepID=UPI00332E4E20
MSADSTPISASPYVTELDGRPATAADLAPLAFAGYAHFTAAQVRDRRIRGLDLHLERLRAASLTLFGRAVPDEEVRGRLRTALAAGPADVSVTVTVYSPEGEFTARAHPSAAPRLLVRTGPPATGPEGPLALALVPHERVLPEVKHVGEIAKTLLLRRAVADGFDDAAFLDGEGRLSEATIWNLVFWDGTSVLWPQAAMLTGTTMSAVRRRLTALGVPQRTTPITPSDLPALAGAAVMNSWTPGIPVHRLGPVTLPPAPDFLRLLHDAYETEAWVAP